MAKKAVSYLKCRAETHYSADGIHLRNRCLVEGSVKNKDTEDLRQTMSIPTRANWCQQMAGYLVSPQPLPKAG